MAEIAIIFNYIGYATQGLEFFNQVNDLDNQQFKDASLLLRDIHTLVAYGPDKQLQDKIDVLYERYNKNLANWDTLENNTKTAFAKEILEGAGSVHNLIGQFHKSFYEKDGSFDVKTNNILDEERNGFLTRLLTKKNQSNAELAKVELKKMFPGLLEVEMKAITLILFGFHLKQSDESRYLTEIELAKNASDTRIAEIKMKIEEALAEADKKIEAEREKTREILISNTHSVYETVPKPIRDTVSFGSDVLYDAANSTYSLAKKGTKEVISLVGKGLTTGLKSVFSIFG